MNRKELEKKVGKIDEAIEKMITDMGTPVEYINDEEIAIEVFPNRPDLLSLQNFARAINQYKGKEGIAEFKLHKPEKNYEVVIEKSVKKVRPHTVCCIVKGMKFDDEKIKEVIDIQEKLHNSIGRKRKKLAIGIYPLEEIKLPITFKAEDPTKFKFKPLEFPRSITGRQILGQHPAGREYGDLLKGESVFPIFVDANKEILSMPPIINSDKTGRISESTKDVFIECSGHNLHYLKKTMAIIVSAFYEMGGKVYAMNVKDKTDGNMVSPDMAPQMMEFKIDDINKTLGTEFSEKQIKSKLEKMGIGFDKKKAKSYALIPAYRTDILHPIDLSEEVAIAHGYDNFEPVIPEISTIAEEDPRARQKRIMSEVLAGLGLLETSSFHLQTKKNIKKIHFEYNDFIELEDSKTERDVLRIDMLTNLMQILSENSDAAYPQKIFEIGRVFAKDTEGLSETGIAESEKLACVLTDESITFTEAKQILDYLFKMIDVKYEIENTEEHPGFVKGRCGKIIVDSQPIGYIGEIAPRVLKNWKLKFPAVAFELDADYLI